jgi:hypothetical protein
MLFPHRATPKGLRCKISSTCRAYCKPPGILIPVATSISNYKLKSVGNCIEHAVSQSLDSYQTGKGFKSNLQWRRGMAVNCIQHFNKSSERTIINNSVQPVFVAIKSLSTYTDLHIPSLSVSTSRKLFTIRNIWLHIYCNYNFRLRTATHINWFPNNKL